MAAGSLSIPAGCLSGNNSWRHIAFTRSAIGQVVNIYVDGNLDSTTSYADAGTINVTGAPGTLVSGGFNAGLKIQDIRIYNRALSGGEANALYNEALAYRAFPENEMPALKPGPAVANGTGTAVSTSVAAGVGRAAAKATGTAVSTSIASGVGHGSTSVVVGTAVSTSSATGVGRALARTTGTAISTSIAAGIGRAMMPGSVGTAVSTSVAAGAGGRIARTTGTAVSKSVAEGSGYAAGVVVSTYRKPATVQVPDVRIVQNNQYPAYDVTLDWSLLPNGTLDDTKALATAVTIALGTNALADPSEPLPDPDSTDRGGWWGDMDAELIWNAWPIGSKLWLLRRSKIVNAGRRRLALRESWSRTTFAWRCSHSSIAGFVPALKSGSRGSIRNGSMRSCASIAARSRLSIWPIRCFGEICRNALVHAVLEGSADHGPRLRQRLAARRRRQRAEFRPAGHGGYRGRALPSHPAIHRLAVCCTSSRYGGSRMARSPWHDMADQFGRSNRPQTGNAVREAPQRPSGLGPWSIILTGTQPGDRSAHAGRTRSPMMSITSETLADITTSTLTDYPPARSGCS